MGSWNILNLTLDSTYCHLKTLVKGRIHKNEASPRLNRVFFLSLIVSDSCTLIIVHTFYGSNQRNPVTY